MNMAGIRSRLSMTFLPLFFKNNLSCLVVGGGQVATRKIEVLTEMPCAVTVIAPHLTDLLEKRVREGSVRWLQREFTRGDCKGFQLIIAATPARGVNRRVSEEATDLGIPINVVDDLELSSVIFPAVWRDGPLLVAVSTAGTAPFMAAEIRTRLAGCLRQMGRWVDIGGRFREIVREEIRDPDQKMSLYRKFLEAGEPEEFSDPPDTSSLSDWVAWLDAIRKHRPQP